MYGTVAKLKVKPGKLEAFKALMQEPMSASGALSGYVYQTDENPHELYLTVVFESAEAYKTNADSPETNAEFEKMMQYLVSEPEWHDGMAMRIF